MDIEPDFEGALRHGDPRTALRALVAQLIAADGSQSTVYARFDAYRAALRAAGRAHDEDQLLEVMDEIVGWCSPHARLFPTDRGP